MGLFIKHPYFASALWSLRMYKSDKVPTMGVDKRWNLYYNEEFVENSTKDILILALYHEIMHLLYDHHRLHKNLNQVVANISGDLEINDDLARDGYQVIESKFLHPVDTFGFPENLLSLEYYKLLMESQSKGDGSNKSKEGLKNPQCGSCSHGGGEEWEEQEGGISDGVGDLIRSNVAREAKEAGNAPAGLKRWAESFGVSKVDWRKVLSAKIKRSLNKVSGLTDYTYSKPSRRQGGSIIYPSMYTNVPSVSVVIDTSGSMSEDNLNSALREVNKVLTSFNGNMTVDVLSCDVASSSVQKVFKASQINLMGGGGTDMGIGIADADKLKRSVIICLTDGYTNWDIPKPKADLIIGLIGSNVKTPEWATTVLID